MSRAYVIFLTFFICVAFTVTPQGGRIGFLLSDHTVTAETYAYYLWEYAVKIVLFHVIHVESKTYVHFFRFMFWFQVADLADYILTYNDIWGYLGIFPISMNTVGAAIGGCFLLKEHLE